MKKNILISAIAVCATLFSCQKKELVEIMPAYDELHAVTEVPSGTRTVMDGYNNVLWSAGDQISAFMKTSLGLKYQLKDSYAGKTSGSFSKVASASSDDLVGGMELDHIVAYYPYSESVMCSKASGGYALQVVLPSEQTYAPDSFGSGVWPMVAVCEDNDITFKNVCGGLKLQLKGIAKVKTIELKGNAGEILSGEASVTVYPDETLPSIAMASDASRSVLLDCGDGVQLNEETATEFILTVPPVAFDNGFTVTVTDARNGVAVLSTDKANPIRRSAILSMPVMEIETEPVFTPTDYCISATFEITEDNEKTSLFGDVNVGGEENPIVAIDCGDGTIINKPQSNDWWYTYIKAGNYNVKYYFDSPLEKINDRGFINCPDMTSILIPSTVKSIGSWAFSMGGSHSLKLHTVVFDEDSQLEIIGEYAFGCTSLSQFTIPSNVHTIGKYAFGACHNLPIINPGSNQRFMTWTTDGNLGLRHDDGSYTLISYAAGHPATEVHIHRWVFDVVADGAVSNCRNIRKIIFEDELKYLGDIGHNCPNLEEVEGLELIGEHSITSISFCSTNLKSIRIPSNIISVGGFSGNNNLSSIIIEEGVKGIDGGFAFGSAVSEITIPSSVTSIAEGAFGECPQLSVITIPSGVTTISSSFNNAPLIKTVYISASVPPALSDSFDSVPQDAVFYVPAASLDAYRSASGWERFSDMFAPYDYPVDYIDEYGVNHGSGVEIDGVVWAPVNCGYHATDFKYGKLYQWGRRYGQGYSGKLYDIDGNVISEDYSDTLKPNISAGSTSVYYAEQNPNTLYVGAGYHVAAFQGGNTYYFWDESHKDGLWNSGTGASPVKSDYDPCPEGWRVPTYTELQGLIQNHSSVATADNGQVGCCFSGEEAYADGCRSLFLSASGRNNGSDGRAENRGLRGYYWSSDAGETARACAIDFKGGTVNQKNSASRADGYSVRCVQE